MLKKFDFIIKRDKVLIKEQFLSIKYRIKRKGVCVHDSKIITEAKGVFNFLIRPGQINCADLSGTFGWGEVEGAAARLVRFCQIRSGWIPFRAEELTWFYLQNHFEVDMMFSGLLGDFLYQGEIVEAPHYLVQDLHGFFYFTELFVLKCARKA